MKTVFVVLPGPSVKSLQENIEAVQERYPDVLWAGMNHYRILEDQILTRVNKLFDIVTYLDPHVLPFYLPEICEFLNRPMNNMFVSDYHTIKAVEEAIKSRVANVKGSVVYSSFTTGRVETVSPNYYNTLTAMLLTLISLGYREFALFGADGSGEYFGEKPEGSRDGIDTQEIQRRLKEDTDFMNDHFWALVDTITREYVDITNFSQGSKLTCFDLEDVEAIV